MGSPVALTPESYSVGSTHRAPLRSSVTPVDGIGPHDHPIPGGTGQHGRVQTADLIVIGAGPAGAAAAMQAARGGAQVIVFDRAPYGRDKVCGDGLDLPRHERVPWLENRCTRRSSAHAQNAPTTSAGRVS